MSNRNTGQVTATYATAVFLLLALPAWSRAQSGHEAVVPAVVPAGTSSAACDLTQVVVPPGVTFLAGDYPSTSASEMPIGYPDGFIIDPPSHVSDAYRWISIIHSQYSNTTTPPHMPLPGHEGHDYRSACWWPMATSAIAESYPIVRVDTQRWGTPPDQGPMEPLGFRLGINLLGLPSIGDFLPRAPTVGADSIALVPPGAAGALTGWQGGSRPVLDGALDLVTGLPLIQVTDLELPFGGATFRLQRTRSGTHGRDWVSDTLDENAGSSEGQHQPRALDKWWDWTGLGWMAGENPLLLIDSALPDVVGPHPRTTWLVLDAHHAIPFQQVNAGHLASSGSPPAVLIDGLVKHHAYDGLGRLASTQSPVTAGLRTERFYYDGIRRLQEVATDPVSSGGDSLMAGDPGALESFAAEPQLDIETLTLVGENSQSLLGGIGGNQPPPTTGLVREYVWGPGDNGVDELLAQYDLNRAPTWVMQDAGLDCVALADLGGSSGAARVVWQGVYDAYGSVLSAESLYSHASLHAGHKGLFFDRLDVGLLASSGAENPRLVATSKLLGHVRNRAYLPNLGRWAQKDPNASGLTEVEAAERSGQSPLCSPNPFDVDLQFADGVNLHAYLRSSPLTNFDPLGLAIPEGASPFDVGMAPTMLAILASVEQRILAFAAQHYAKLIVAGELAAGMANPDPTASPLWAGIGATGRFGEQILEFLGGETHVFYRTSPLFRRFVDRVADGVAYEVKTGYHTLTVPVAKQIAKDAFLLNTHGSDGHPIEAMVWVFFKSPVTGEGGASEPLKQALRAVGIRIMEILE